MSPAAAEKMKLFICRHAQSMGNIDRHQTPNDGLSDLGKKQAEAIPEFFRQHGMLVTHIFSSPFRRVIETATPLAEKSGRPIMVVPELCEVFSGERLLSFEWENGRQIEKSFPRTSFSPRFHPDERWWPDQQETEIMDVKKRVTAFYHKEIVPLCQGDARVVVFSHGIVTAYLKKLACPLSVSEKENAAIFYYDLEKDGMSLQEKKGTRHLNSIPFLK